MLKYFCNQWEYLKSLSIRHVYILKISYSNIKKVQNL